MVYYIYLLLNLPYINKLVIFNTMIHLIHSQATSAELGSLLFLFPKSIKYFGYPIFRLLGVPDEVYSRNESCAIH